MSLFTIKHVHEGTVEIEVEHKYSGEKVIVDNNRVPQATAEHTREESVKKNDGSIDSRIGDIYLGLGVSILLGLYLEETIGGDVCGKIITGILGAFFVFLGFGYTTKLGKKIVKCLKCIFLFVLVLLLILIVIGLVNKYWPHSGTL